MLTKERVDKIWILEHAHNGEKEREQTKRKTLEAAVRFIPTPPAFK